MKNGGKGLDESCVVSLKGCSEKAIYNTTIGIIRKINENYEESFEYITDLIEGREYSKNMHKEEFSTYNFIEDLTKTESKLGLKGLASELGYDVKTLYNRRVKRTFKREELFYIAVRFGISVNDLNKLLRENGRQELGYSGKDGVIRRALIDGLSIFDVECELGESIISPKEDKSE